MKDPELRELTASEELTLEEEYEMQGASSSILCRLINLKNLSEKWQTDEDS